MQADIAVLNTDSQEQQRLDFNTMTKHMCDALNTVQLQCQWS